MCRNEVAGFCNNKDIKSQLKQTPSFHHQYLLKLVYKGFSNLKEFVATWYMCSDVLKGQATGCRFQRNCSPEN